MAHSYHAHHVHAHDDHSDHDHGPNVNAPVSFGTAFAIGIILNTASVAPEVILGFASNVTAQ